MSYGNISTQKPSLTADRYKLLIPFHAHRDKPLKTKVSSPRADESSPDEPSLPQLPSQFQLGKKRLVLPVISNENVKYQIDIVKQYFSESEILTVIETLTTQLLLNPVLPYNPYPGYIRRFRRIAEKFYYGRKSLNEIKQSLDTKVFTADNSYLVGVKQPNVSVWGLQHIVAHINPKTLESYRNLLSFTITNEHASGSTGHQVSILQSLCGPGVFSNSVYGELPLVDIRVSVLISHQSMKEAMHVFAQVVIEDIKMILSSELQQLLEFRVSVKKKNSWTQREFSRFELTSMLTGDDADQSKIETMISECIAARRIISLKLMTSNSDRLIGNFTFTNKFYDLLYLHSSPSQSKAGRADSMFVSTFPYIAFLEGVFLDLAHADLYRTTFEKHYVFPNGKRATKAYPLNSDILNPIIQSWEQTIAKNILEHSAFSVVHFMLLVHLARNKINTFAKHTEKDFVIQVSRFYSGTAVRLHGAWFMAQALSSLKDPSGESIDSTTSEVLRKINSLLSVTLDDCFSSLSPEKRIMKDLLESIFSTSLVGANKRTMKQFICCLSYAILSASEDVLEASPAILSYKAEINSSYPQLVPSFSDVPEQSNNQYGIANSSWINVDAAKVDMVKSINSSTAPKSVASSTSMMQYCMDIRMDDIWREFMELLLLEVDYLPPNPFLHLVALMRRGNMSVLSLFEENSAIVSRIVQRTRLPLQGMSEVFNVPGTTAYGYRSSLCFFNTIGFRQISAIASSLFIATPGETTSGSPVQLGAFRMIACSGFVDSCVYYGSVSPNLPTIDVDEHIFIIGPHSDSVSPLPAFAQAVLSFLLDVRGKGAILHQAKLGQIRLDLFTVANLSVRFISELTTAVEGSQTIVISFYFPLAWRYILVSKRLLVYFTDQRSNRTTRMFQHSSYSEKRSFTIFLHPVDANYSLRPGRILPHVISNSIKAAWPSRDWSRMVKFLTTHAQFLLAGGAAESKTLSSVGESSSEGLAHVITAFAYRYNNGLPGQIDYLIALNSALEDIVSHALSSLSEQSDLSSFFRLSLIDTMAEEFMIKLKEVTSRPSALTPASFPDLLLVKLKALVPRDPNSNSLHVKYGRKSLEVLQEIGLYLTSLRNILAEDLLQATPVVMKLIKSQT